MNNRSVLDILEQVKEKRSLRLSLLKCKTREETLIRALSLAREKLKVQSASIFLFNKVGLLERIHIESVDSKGRNIREEDWGQETYAIGESITGKVVEIQDKGFYGTPKIINFPIQEKLDKSTKNKLQLYSKRLGKVKCIASFPLDGQNRTYGVLEIVNKLPNPELSSSISEVQEKNINRIQEEDIKFLADFSTYVSSCISNAKHEERNKLLSILGQTLVKARITDGLNKTLNSVLKHLVSSRTSFEACILRVVDDGLLKVAAEAGDERINLALRNNGERIIGEGFAGKTFAEKKARHFLIGEKELKKFKNEVWIRENQLKSFGCFPLVVEGRVVGTLSIFTGYEYTFHESAITFIEAVTSIFASFVYKEQLETWKRTLQKLKLMDVPESDPGPIKLRELINARHFVDLAIGLSKEDSGDRLSKEDSANPSVTKTTTSTVTLNNIESYKEYRKNPTWVNDNKGKFVAFVDSKWLRSSKDGSEESRKAILYWLAKSFPDQQRFLTKVESDIDSEIIDMPMSSSFDGFQDDYSFDEFQE